MVTAWRFAMAKPRISTASGSRMMAVRNLRITSIGVSRRSDARAGSFVVVAVAARIVLVQALAHFLADLEERHAFLLDGDVGSGARIAAGAGRALLHREGAEAAQLDPVATRQRGDDL